MDAIQTFKMLAALVFVVALMGVLTLILKKLGLQGQALASGKKRLKIVEILPLDARRRLALIERDDVQHLVILGASGETVIETNIDNSEKGNDKDD
jgi:flagellar protein FliO/FliZ